MIPRFQIPDPYFTAYPLLQVKLLLFYFNHSGTPSLNIFLVSVLADDILEQLSRSQQLTHQSQ